MCRELQYISAGMCLSSYVWLWLAAGLGIVYRAWSSASGTACCQAWKMTAWLEAAAPKWPAKKGTATTPSTRALHKLFNVPSPSPAPHHPHLPPSRLRPPSGRIALPEGTQMVVPGDNFRATVELMSPVAMDIGMRFAIRDSGRTVGAGVVTKLVK